MSPSPESTPFLSTILDAPPVSPAQPDDPAPPALAIADATAAHHARLDAAACRAWEELHAIRKALLASSAGSLAGGFAISLCSVCGGFCCPVGPFICIRWPHD